jgi:hypothetical protein
LVSLQRGGWVSVVLPVFAGRENMQIKRKKWDGIAEKWKIRERRMKELELPLSEHYFL